MAVRDKGIQKAYTWSSATLVYSLCMDDYNPLVTCIRDHNVEDGFFGSTEVRSYGRIKHRSIRGNHCMAGLKENHQIKEGKYSITKIGEMASLITTTMVGDNRIICKDVNTNRLCRANCWFIRAVRIFDTFNMVDMRRTIVTSYEKLVSVRDFRSQYSIRQRGGWSYICQDYLSTWHRRKEDILYEFVVSCILKLIYKLTVESWLSKRQQSIDSPNIQALRSQYVHEAILVGQIGSDLC